RIRLDIDALADHIRRDAARDEATLAVITICGTTEEGAVDPLHRVEALREDLASEGLSFWHHADGAFGGFFAAMIPRDEQGVALAPESPHPAVRELVDQLVGEDVYRSIVALSQADSVTIDPHKLGYIPYPAGAVLFRDYVYRDAISYAAPYLATEEQAGFSGFLGQWTLEGSRPGAAAVSCYLSQEALPLTPDGHGRLMKECIAANRAIVTSLGKRFDEEDADWVTFRPFAVPDSIGFCFILEPHRSLSTLADQNALTAALWNYVAVDGRDDIGQYHFLLSKTEVRVGAYRSILQDVLPRIDFSAVHDDERLILLRVFVLNPFIAEWNRQDTTFAGLFGEFLYDVASKVFPVHVLRSFRERTGRRLSLKVMEQAGSPYAVGAMLRDDPMCSAYLDVETLDPETTAPTADRLLLNLPALGEPAAAVRKALRSSDSDHVIVRGSGIEHEPAFPADTRILDERAPLISSLLLAITREYSEDDLDHHPDTNGRTS
ncbi:MAG: tyrosine decarboxylase, partial [Bacteroidota bacterium]